jgi:PAS domain S-box-containing protein
VLFLAMLAIADYAYGKEQETGIAFHTRMAVHTAFAFLMLGTGLILLRMEESGMAFLTSSGAGATLMRYLLPAVLFIPPLVGWLRVQGQMAGLFETNYGTALMATSVSALLVLGVLITGQLVERLDRARREAVEKVAIQSAEIQDLYDRAPCGYHSLDAEGRFIQINGTELEWLGYAREELVGRLRVTDLMTPESVEVFTKAFPQFKASGRARDLRFHLRRKDGSILPVLVNASAVRDGEGQLLYSRTSMQDITELEKAESLLRAQQRELVEANRELARKNVELDEFVSVAGHDLQAPLRQLISFGELLRRDLPEALPMRAREDLDHLSAAAQRMHEMLQGLLVLARAGKGAMARELVALDACLDAALKDLQSYIREVGAEVIRVPLPTVRGDSGMLTRVFQNLIGNALKFRRPGAAPRVQVGVDREGALWKIAVEDDGIGIRPQHLAEIFHPFKRLHGRGQFEGSGLGLAICRKVLERHGGRIWAEAREEAGTRFVFSLPAEDETAGGVAASQ